MILDPKEKPVVSAEEAFKLLGIDRGTGYSAIRNNTFHVPVIRIGRIIRVPTVPLCKILSVNEPEKITETKADNNKDTVNEGTFLFQFIQIKSF